MATSSPPKDVATSDAHKSAHLAHVDPAVTPVAAQIKPPTQAPSRHTSFIATRRRPKPEVEEQRILDARHRRAAYLGQWRQSCRVIFDVIAEPHNTIAVDDLRSTIRRRWKLYESAHQVYLAKTDLSARKAGKLKIQDKQHAQEHDDAVRTLEA